MRFVRTLLAVYADESSKTCTASSDRITSTSITTATGARTARPVQVCRTRVVTGRSDPAVTAVTMSVCRTARRVVLTVARFTTIDAVINRLTSWTQIHLCTWLCPSHTRNRRINQIKDRLIKVWQNANHHNYNIK